MSKTMFHVGRIGPATALPPADPYCQTCDGAGTGTEVRDRVDIIHRCEDCDGTGLRACCYCGAREVAAEGEDGGMCGACAADYEAEGE